MRKNFSFILQAALLLSLLVLYSCKGYPDVAGTYIGTANQTSPRLESQNSPFGKAFQAADAIRVTVVQDNENLTIDFTFTGPGYSYPSTGTIADEGAFTASGSTTTNFPWSYTETGSIDEDTGIYLSKITFNKMVSPFGTWVYNVSLQKQ